MIHSPLRAQQKGPVARLFPLDARRAEATFWHANEAAKASARERIGKNLSVAADHLESRQHVVGERFTVADAYLAWSLLLLKYGGVDVADWPPLVSYLDRIRQRPQVKAAIETEQEIRKTLTVRWVAPSPRPLSRSSRPPPAV